MSLPACIFALLCLVSPSLSAPLTCDDLIRPLDRVDRHHLEGKWVLAAGSLANPEHQDEFKSNQHGWVNFSNYRNSSQILLSLMLKQTDRCEHSSANITIEGNSFRSHISNITWRFIHTSCSDCFVLRHDESDQLYGLYLVSRRRQVGEEEMDEFQAQVKCLNLSSPATMDPTKELCPEQTASSPAEEGTEEKA